MYPTREWEGFVPIGMMSFELQSLFMMQTAKRLRLFFHEIINGFNAIHTTSESKNIFLRLS